MVNLTLNDFLIKLGFSKFGKYAFIIRSKDLLNSLFIENNKINNKFTELLK